MDLQKQLEWLEILIQERISDIPHITNYGNLETPAILEMEEWEKEGFVEAEEIIITLLALAFAFMPETLNKFIYAENETKTGLVGGVINNQSGTPYFLPTTRTALFLLAGKNIQKRVEITKKYFLSDSPLFKNNILHTFVKDPLMEDCVLEISSEFFYRFGYQLKYHYSFNASFPASLYTTPETWEDLVLNPSVQANLKDVKLWMKHYPELNKNELYKGSKGLKVLFWGESGTGKTVSVGILGKEAGKDVYRIDLSQIVSKYVGETEKNLKQIFDLAQNKDWILFFDEGDALLGKRTDNKSANDRYGNQEIAYLLQRMEDFEGILFLCTNKKDNLDDAFKRRFHLRFEFSQPFPTVRYEIWIKAFEEFKFKNVPVEYASDKLKDMNGAWIKSFARYCKVLAMDTDSEEGYIFDTERFFRTLRDFYMAQGRGVHEINAICKEIGLPIWKDIIM